MEDSPKRIEYRTSKTAEMTCVTRAASFFEKNSCYKSEDYIAPKLLPSFMLPFIRMKIVRNIYKNIMSPKGIYEYIIARTKYIDTVFNDSIKKQFEQVLIFGAGFDSRGIRFLPLDSKTKIFELDVPITQNAKIAQLKKRKIKIHTGIIFVPTDFNKEFLEEKLADSGFENDKKTLYLLEGITMYLKPEAVVSTFQMINKYSSKGSEIVFDFIYSSVLRRENKYYGEYDIYEFVSKAGEGWTFGIEKEQVKSFLNEYDFQIIDLADTEKLERIFFTDTNGKPAGKVNGTHCIVRAVK